MKALLLTKYGKHGLALKDVPEPSVRARDLLVEIQGASINPIDFKIQDGQVRVLLPLTPPLILGNDFAGRVIGVGENVTRFKVGDAVFGRPRKDRIGTLAERIAVDEADCARMPENVSFVEAASFPLVGLTAWQAFFERMKIEEGKSVFIHAGSGGVGSCAIQVAKAHGLYVATTTSTSNVEWVKKLGADVVIDYTKQRFEEQLKDFDAVLDTLGGDHLNRSFQILKPGGIVVSVSAIPTAETARELGRPWWVQALLKLASHGIRKKAVAHRVKYDFLFMHPSGEQLEQICQLVEAKKLSPVIDRTFPLDEAVEALAYVRTGRAKGKVVVTPTVSPSHIPRQKNGKRKGEFETR